MFIKDLNPHRAQRFASEKGLAAGKFGKEVDSEPELFSSYDKLVLISSPLFIQTQVSPIN